MRPCILSDVWITLTLGKHPSAKHWFMMENVAVMAAWLPTADASRDSAMKMCRIRSVSLTYNKSLLVTLT